MGSDDLLETLRASGAKAARAQITGAKSGKKIRGDGQGQPDQLIWKLTLRVIPDDAGSFDAKVQAPYPARAGGPPLGTVVGVLYDPKNHSRLAVDPTVDPESFGQLQADTMNQIVAQGMRAGGLVIAGGQVIQGGARPAPSAPPASTPSTNVADELEKLSKLRDQGALTEAEFQAQKQKLLGA
jgi:Short C-terminal domain